eukprot:CAMPEP_0197652850 /NCGR_PEP_ID=MMETSP1338-20131121/34694_1 /TAXON_ID=43686 ORGANISM="Pelagodinium beii, Strain RCC1491" /NCGR_SAMPLE_ID=MMETSP1338 /ASSEMBLY_ACC=CAM_ASM_000754 /LENGTH=254 /DNA_ID=CAMNT_0043227799 /DNA_START=62 /DNA_END=823 /DNA_ORIENTATION=+
MSPPQDAQYPSVEGSKRRPKGLLRNLFSREKPVQRRPKRASSSSQVPEEVVPNYLENFGFMAADAKTWMDMPLDEVPEGLERSGAWIMLGVAEHYERKGHTWYRLDCSLSQHGTKTVGWQVARRLSQLRKLWHDKVKADLGEEYATVFSQAPFARHGGRRGTSARLDKWCERLATSINSGLMSPAVVALTLRFLEADRCDTNVSQTGDCSKIWRDECGRSTQCSETGSFESPRFEDNDECSDESYESDFESETE